MGRGVGDAVFRSVSPGPGDIGDMMLHSGVLINTANNKISNNSSDNKIKNNHSRKLSEGLENKVCRNLRYSLDQLMLAGDRDLYTR